MKNFQWEYVAWAKSARLADEMSDIMQEARELTITERRAKIIKYKAHINNRPSIAKLRG